MGLHRPRDAGRRCKGKRSSFATSEHTKTPDDDIENWRHQILKGGAKKECKGKSGAGPQKAGPRKLGKDCGVQYADKLVLVKALALQWNLFFFLRKWGPLPDFWMDGLLRDPATEVRIRARAVSLCLRTLYELSEGLIIGTCNGNRVLIEERVRSRRA